MTVQIKPEFAKFIQEQVDAGQFRSADEAVNAALARMRAESALLDEALDDDDVAAIEQGLAQLNSGQGTSWNDFRDRFKKERLGD